MEIVYHNKGLRMAERVVYEDKDYGAWLAIAARGKELRYNPARHFTVEDCNKISEFVKECDAASNDIEAIDAKLPKSCPDTPDTAYDILLTLVHPLISALLVPAAPMYRGAYHSKCHVEEMLRIAIGCRTEIAAACPCFKNMLAWTELFNAIVWHDAHASLKEPFNELHAAKVYASCCSSASGVQYDAFMDRATNQLVIDDILATRVGFQDFKTDVQRVLHDLDWYCFSNIYRLRWAEERIFEEYQQQGLGTEAQAVEARRQFYIEILASKQPIFVSAWMKDRNDDAIKLIQERIEYLAGGRSDDPDSVFP